MSDDEESDDDDEDDDSSFFLAGASFFPLLVGVTFFDTTTDPFTTPFFNDFVPGGPSVQYSDGFPFFVIIEEDDSDDLFVGNFGIVYLGLFVVVLETLLLFIETVEAEAVETLLFFEVLAVDVVATLMLFLALALEVDGPTILVFFFFFFSSSMSLAFLSAFVS